MNALSLLTKKGIELVSPSYIALAISNLISLGISDKNSFFSS